MGMNTVIMFRNDAYDDFEKNPEQTVQNILAAMRNAKNHHYGVGSSANPMEPMKSIHADTNTVYIHSGNTLVEMNAYSDRMERLMIQFPDFFNSMFETLKWTVKSLKEKIKESK
jgi:hypothetical protein